MDQRFNAQLEAIRNELRDAPQVEATGDKERQRAYNIAKDLKSNPDWDPRTQKIAGAYFDLVHKHGTEAQRAKAAQDLLDQLDAEKDSAESTARVAGQHKMTMRAVLPHHQKAAKGESVEPQTEAPDLLRAVAGKAAALKDMATEIESAARNGNYAAVDNWSMKSRQLEAACRLLVKHLKKAEGKAMGEDMKGDPVKAKKWMDMVADDFKLGTIGQKTGALVLKVSYQLRRLGEKELQKQAEDIWNGLHDDLRGITKKYAPAVKNLSGNMRSLGR